MQYLRIAALALLSCLGSWGMSAKETPPKSPDTIFSSPLQDVPGKRLIVVSLEIQPRSAHPFTAHRHPGSVYVYVTRGSARLGIEGQPVQEVHAGQSFFEPPGALHTVGESASDTEPAAAIAVMIVPDGAPLLTVEPQH
jgi:quercetin dioxygenase-like cupin family protein